MKYDFQIIKNFDSNYLMIVMNINNIISYHHLIFSYLYNRIVKIIKNHVKQSNLKAKTDDIVV